MRIVIDVYDSAGNRVGEGPVYTAKGAKITRVLDGAGAFSLDVPATDSRALALFEANQRVHIYADNPDSTLRLFGAGIITQVKITDSEGGATLHIEGPDLIEELKRRSVLLARIYNQETVQDVIDDLIALVPSWSATVDAGIASNVIDARFDGVSVLKALQEIVGRYGYHLRLSDATVRTLEIGTFGASNGLRLHKVESVTSETVSNPELLMVEQIERAELSETDNVYNWLLPLGAGEGIAALTLEASTRNSPYVISSMTGPDGTTLYYLDATGDSNLGDTIQKVGQFKEIAPLSNTDADIENAANALYDAAVEALNRHKDAQVSYAVQVRGLKESIQPGDKVHINYKARLPISGGVVNYLDVRGDFYIIQVQESIGLEAVAASLEISNVDRYQKTEAEKVFDAIDAIELRGLKPSIASSTRSYVYMREIAPSFPAVVPIEFTDATLSVQRVRLRLKTGPFRVTASSGSTVTSSSNGAHRHRMWRYDSDASGGTTGTWWKNVTSWSGGTFSGFVMGTAKSDDVYTEESTGAHTHTIPSIPLVFGISDDTVNPTGVTVWVNGTDRTLALFGSATLAGAGAVLDVVADVGALTGYLTGAVGGLRQVHEIEVRCSSNRGRVEVTIEVFETTQAIKLV